MFVCPPPLACFPSLLLRLSPSISRHITHALQGGSGVCLTLTPMFFFLFCSLSVHLVLNANVAINCLFLCWGTLIMGNTIREMEGLLLFSLHSLFIHPISVISLTILVASSFFVFPSVFSLCQSCSLYFDWGSCVRLMSLGSMKIEVGLFLVLSFISLVLFTLSREGSLFLSNF